MKKDEEETTMTNAPPQKDELRYNQQEILKQNFKLPEESVDSYMLRTFGFTAWSKIELPKTNFVGLIAYTESPEMELAYQRRRIIRVLKRLFIKKFNEDAKDE